MSHSSNLRATFERGDMNEVNEAKIVVSW